MDITIGDTYIRHSDEKLWRVKRIDNKKVVLESLDGSGLTVTDVFGLEKGYTKKVPRPLSPLNNHAQVVPTCFHPRIEKLEHLPDPT